MDNPIPQLREIGIRSAFHIHPQDGVDPEFVAATKESQHFHESERLNHLALADMLSAMPEEVLTPGSDLYEIGESYLAEDRKQFYKKEGIDPEEVSLVDYGRARALDYNLRRLLSDEESPADPEAITTGLIAELAREAADRQPDLARQAGQLILYKHATQQNIAILESQLPEADRELYASVRPNRDIQRNPIEVNYYGNDPEARELSDRYTALEIAFSKRWVLQSLAKTLGIEDATGLSREQIEAAAQLLGQYGDAITD